MKEVVTSYKQLNILVAKSIGWITSDEYMDNGEFTSDTEVIFWHPCELEEDDIVDWFYAYRVVPKFCRDFFLLAKFVVPAMENCNYFPDFSSNPITITSPDDLALPLCLDWLRFNDIEVELKIEHVDMVN